MLNATKYKLKFLSDALMKEWTLWYLFVLKKVWLNLRNVLCNVTLVWRVYTKTSFRYC